MIVLFARANHPRSGWSIAHGYVVFGVRCAHEGEALAVKDKVIRDGIRLPDKGRHSGTASVDVDWSMVAWYSGNGGDFDYLVTVDGDALPEQVERTVGSRGDNRFFWIYDADEVLT